MAADELPFRAMGFVARVNADGSQTMTLPTLMGKYLHEAQIAFGARDLSWTPIGIAFCAVGPMAIFLEPQGCRQALIMLSIEASHDLNRAAYELAHEVVHLLAPNTAGPEATINLEEGCAEAFAHLQMQHMGWEHPLMHLSPDNPYEQARLLTLQLLTVNGAAIRKLRQIEPHFSSITPAHFAEALPEVPERLAQALCQPFEYDEESKALRSQAVVNDGNGHLSEWFAKQDPLRG